MTTALFILRAVQLGLSLFELDALEVGDIYDMFAESENDNYNYKEIATQSDFDRF